jgi:nucleoside-diphosphate-sugar epimerase
MRPALTQGGQQPGSVMATPTITPTTQRGLVVVTGGSGYIAGYCIAQLLNEGWRVRTTVRNLGRAEEVHATIGKVATNAFYWMADIAKILKQGLGEKARKVPSIPVPDFLVRVIAIFDPVARGRLYELGKPRQVSSEKARRMLGWTTRLVPETILDTAKSLQAQGLV